MSSIKLTADSNGGTFELKAPSSSSNTRVLTLPDTANGTVLTTTNPRSGNIIQVVQTVKTDTFTTSSTSKVDITGMSASITPQSTSSKILVDVSLSYGGNNFNFFCDLLRGSTVIGVPASGNNNCTLALCGITTTTYQIFNSPILFLDSPSTTSATTYKLQIACQSGGEFFLNKSKRDSTADGTCTSSITLSEVAG
jgi:hypothetical protein